MQVLEKLIISKTVHTTTKLFVPFYSAQDGKSTDMNYLMFRTHCENGQLLTKHQVYNKWILPILGKYEQYEILISPESAVDSE